MTKAEQVIELIGEEALSIRKACDRVDMKPTTFLRHVESEGLAERYTRAREARADLLFDELIEIADEPQGQSVDDNGNVRLDSGWQQHKKQRIDTRKWMLARMNAGKYGDRIEQNITSKSEVTNKIDLSKVPDEVLKKLLDAQGGDES